jgi:hypothetical protein
MHHQCSLERTRAEQYEPERKIEVAAVLLRETIEHLVRDCPPPLLGTAAREDLLDLKPHLQEALAALADIERLRCLTDEELSGRRAFKMLLLAETLLT